MLRDDRLADDTALIRESLTITCEQHTMNLAAGRAKFFSPMGMPTRTDRLEDPSDWRCDGRSELARYLGEGGDSRLALEASSHLNKYGCSLVPREISASFGSSTASCISARAFHRAGLALTSWKAATRTIGSAAAIDRHVDRTRGELANLLGLNETDVDIILSPSGTDSQLHALALARAATDGSLVTIVVAADETGSGTAFTASGRHFDDQTALGRPVQRGAQVDGFSRIAQAVPINVNTPSGPRSAEEIDGAVCAAVAEAVDAGCDVVLQAMNCSKLGGRYPSDACLEELRSKWAGRVQIVIDACQMRLSRTRIRRHLRSGDMVIITGSKFFTGPAFSGALLAPARLCTALERRGRLPAGLADYTHRYQWPIHRRRLREVFPPGEGLGAWLRWEAALAEMSAYYAVPQSFRRYALSRFALAAEVLSAEGCRRSLPRFDASPGDEEDEEFAVQTIFPFQVCAGTTPASPQGAAMIHRRLNVAGGLLPSSASHEDRRHAQGTYIIGQPVPLTRSGVATALLRVCADARYVSDCWQADDPEGCAADHLLELGRMFDKVEVLQKALTHD